MADEAPPPSSLTTGATLGPFTRRLAPLLTSIFFMVARRLGERAGGDGLVPRDFPFCVLFFMAGSPLRRARRDRYARSELFFLTFVVVTVWIPSHPRAA
jgi:hypothetical protein